MIDFQLKDAVLNALCENMEPERNLGSPFKDYQDVIATEITFSELNAILSQFQRMGLISDLNARPIYISLVLNLEAIDFHNRGGFTIQEEMFQNAYNKLSLEVKSLSNDFPERAERFTTILASFATIGTFFGMASK